MQTCHVMQAGMKTTHYAHDFLAGSLYMHARLLVVGIYAPALITVTVSCAYIRSPLLLNPH